MKTIKAKDAKFGRFYEYDRTGRIRCVHEDSVDNPTRFADRYGRIVTIHGLDITELPAECDSFDWQPAPKSEEVRWYLDEYVNLLQGYGPSGELVVCLDSGETGNGNNANEERREKDTRLTTPEVLCRLAQAGHNDAWNGARKLAGLSEQEAYLAGQSVCGIKEGDTVRVTRKAEDKEMGWPAGCFNVDAVDSLWIVYAVDDGSYDLSDNCWHPFFVLEKIETPAEVAPEIDPGEGWRLIDTSDPNEKPRKGDEYKGLKTGRWLPSGQWREGKEFCEDLVYRRRIQPAADHGFAVGDWFKWNDEVRKISGIDGDHVNTECGHRHFAGHITKVTFRPFANAAEFEPFRDEWYRRKGTDKQTRPSTFSDGFVNGISYDVLFERCEFVSGRPCGVEVAQ